MCLLLVVVWETSAVTCNRTSYSRRGHLLNSRLVGKLTVYVSSDSRCSHEPGFKQSIFTH